MRTVGILDVDFLAGRQHRFPNLAAMKLSSHHKGCGDLVMLVKDYQWIRDFDVLYLCCVFTESVKTIPSHLMSMPNVIKGGTGFYFDHAPPLPHVVEHCRPDYGLYQGLDLSDADRFYYEDASIGFLTRGCVRKCSFCVNRNLTKSVPASPLEEFFDPSKSRVSLWDDNFLACKSHRRLLEGLLQTCEEHNKKFEFKQGIDIRFLTPAVSKLFATPRRYGEMIFAFDRIQDYDQIRRGLRVLKEHHRWGKAYILCGFDGHDEQDIATVFRRLEILWEHQCIGYLMRHENCQKANPICRRMYTNLAQWINQPHMQRTLSFYQFCETANRGQKENQTAMRGLRSFEMAYPEIAKRFFHSSYQGQQG